MAQTSVLKAEVRERGGKGAARAVRREEKVPAVIYGDKKPPMMISLPLRETTRRLHAGGFLTHHVQIEVGGETIRAIPKDYQLDPVRDFLVHVDFLRVGEGARLTIAVPVHFKNHADSPGLKRGGVLNVVRHTIDMWVPADAIPEFVEVDLSGLDIGDSVHISAIALPEGVSPTIRGRDFTVATIAGAASVLPEVEEGAAPAEGEAVEGEAAAAGEAGAEGEAKPKAEAKGEAPDAGKGKGKG
jgi:large subunit ribosomal protein L25